MRIFYISQAVLPSEVSHCLSIMRVCQAFTDEGHDVLLMAVEAKDNKDDPIKYYGLRGGFKVALIKTSRWWNNRITHMTLLFGLVLAFKSRSLIKQLKPDLIYSRLTITELLFIPSTLPLIYEMHSLGPLGRRWFQRLIFKLILRIKNIRRIVVTTDLLADMLRRQLPGIEIIVAPLSAELPVEIMPLELERFRDLHLLGRRFSRHVGYTGYLDKIGLRGTDIICKIAARLPDVAFHIVGGEQDIVEYWRDYAQSFNQNQNIFFYGYRNPAEMPFFLSCFDVVVAPLQFKPSKRAPNGMNMSPLKLAQYMSYGKAIVASDLPSHRALLEHDKTAYLVSAADIDEWVSAIRELLEDASLRGMLGSQAEKKYFNECTPSVRTKKILSEQSI